MPSESRSSDELVIASACSGPDAHRCTVHHITALQEGALVYWASGSAVTVVRLIQFSRQGTDMICRTADMETQSSMSMMRLPHELYECKKFQCAAVPQGVGCSLVHQCLRHHFMSAPTYKLSTETNIFAFSVRSLIILPVRGELCPFVQAFPMLALRTVPTTAMVSCWNVDNVIVASRWQRNCFPTSVSVDVFAPLAAFIQNHVLNDRVRSNGDSPGDRTAPKPR